MQVHHRLDVPAHTPPEAGHLVIVAIGVPVSTAYAMRRMRRIRTPGSAPVVAHYDHRLLRSRVAPTRRSRVHAPSRLTTAHPRALTRTKAPTQANCTSGQKIADSRKAFLNFIIFIAHLRPRRCSVRDHATLALGGAPEVPTLARRPKTPWGKSP